MKIFKRLLQVVLDENQYIKDNVNKYGALTEKEKMIIHYLVNGHNNEFICRILSLSPEGLEHSKRIIYSKLRINKEIELRKFSTAFNLNDLKDVRYKH